MADTVRILLSLLVSVLTQAFLTLVRSHFMPLMLLSVWHNKMIYRVILILLRLRTPLQA